MSTALELSPPPQDHVHPPAPEAEACSHDRYSVTFTLPDNEEGRLRALHALQILDTAPEQELQDLVELAAATCGAPVGLLSFVDRHRQWIKAATGSSLRESHRDLSVCHWTIQQESPLIIEDLRADPRFRSNPLFVKGGNFKFYAGFPLRTAEGYAVGTLCVLDFVTRTLTPAQKRTLQIVAAQVQARLELRTHRNSLQRVLAAAEASRLRAEEAEQRFRAFMDCGPFLAYIKDAAGRMLYYNEAVAAQFKVSREALLHKTDAELWPAHLAASYRMHDLQVLGSGRPQIRYEESSNPDGSIQTWRSFKFPFRSANDQVLLGGVSLDVTEELHREQQLRLYQSQLEAANEHLRELASLDALTGLANRRTFDEAMRSFFDEGRREFGKLSLLMIDIDHFKQHNDRFGHAHGDEVLKQLATCLKGTLRHGDLVARLGGEEFAMLLPGTSGRQAEVLAERILQAVQTHAWAGPSVTVSIGLSTLHPATRDLQHLLGRADEALYAAKCAGRNQVVSYASDAPESLRKTPSA